MIDILVGSQMGAAEYVAEQVAEALVRAGYDVHLHLKPELNHLNRYKTWLIVTSTYGAGDLPDNIQPFADQLAQDQGDLNTLFFAVITLGDSSYDTFCLSGQFLSKMLLEKGANQLINNLEIDAQQPELPEEYALAWLPKLIEQLKTK